MPKKLTEQSLQAAGQPALRTARSLFGKRKDRSTSNKSPEPTRLHRLTGTPAEPLKATHTESADVQPAQDESSFAYQTLPAERMDSEDLASRFKTVEPAGIDEVLLTHGNSA